MLLFMFWLSDWDPEARWVRLTDSILPVESDPWQYPSRQKLKSVSLTPVLGGRHFFSRDGSSAAGAAAGKGRRPAVPFSFSI